MAKKFSISAGISLDDRLTGKLANISKKVTVASAKLSTTVNKLNNVKIGSKLIKALGKSVGLASKLGSKLKSAGKGFALAGLAGITAAGYGFSKMISGAAKSQESKNRIKNEVGEEKYDSVIKSIEDFAKTTKFNEEALMKTYGDLIPTFGGRSTEALDTITNMASRMDKPLDEMMSTFTQAASGEFGELKRYGITSKQLGDGKQLVTYTNSKTDKVTTRILDQSLSVSERQLRVLELLELSGKGGNAASSDNYSTATSNFWGALKGLRDKFMLNGGVLEALSGKIKAITSKLETGALGDKIIAMGKKFSEFIKGIDLGAIWIEVKDIAIELKTAFGELLPAIKATISFIKGTVGFGKEVANGFDILVSPEKWNMGGLFDGNGSDDSKPKVKQYSPSIHKRKNESKNISDNDLPPIPPANLSVSVVGVPNATVVVNDGQKVTKRRGRNQ